MKLSDLRNSRFLTKDDCGDGIVVTFKRFYQDNVSPPDKPAEIKWIAEFEEETKDWVLGPTTGSQVAQYLGSEDSEQWVGKQVVLFNDQSVMFAGKVTGGIRARPFREQVVAEDEIKEDIPW